ncbi:MAG: transposase [Flavobacteriales bacterium Tduv]
MVYGHLAFYKAKKSETIMLTLVNKLVSKTRWVVERTFGSIKRWFGSGKTRYKGLTHVYAQHLMEAMAHNLYRTPGIIMRCL